MLDPREAARLFSLLALIGGLVPLAAPMLGSVLLGVAGWRAMFAAMTVGGTIMLLLALRVLPESRSHATLAQSRGENALRAYRTLLGQPILLCVLLAGSLNSGAMFSYLANSPAVLMDGFGLTPLAYTAVITVNSLGLVLLSHCNRQWLKTRTPDQVLAVVSLVIAVLAGIFLLLAGPLAGNLNLLLLSFFALLCCAAIVQVNAMACALAVDPVRSGSTAALFGGATFAAGALLSWIAGQFYSADGSGLCLIIGMALLGCALSLQVMLRLTARTTDFQTDDLS
jgi:DHA1 family bicyclomycin/chloramphenicol resistance-like MFS transporter